MAKPVPTRDKTAYYTFTRLFFFLFSELWSVFRSFRSSFYFFFLLPSLLHIFRNWMVDHRQFLGGPNSPGAVGFVFFAFISLLLFFLLLSSSFFVKWMRADRGFFMIIFLVVGRHNREKNGLVRKKPTKKMKTLTTNLAVLQRASDGVWISFTSSSPPSAQPF